MRVAEYLDEFAGTWAGQNNLRMMPDDDFATSPSTVVVTSAAGANVVTLSYTWSDFDGVPQDGLLLLGDGPLPGQAAAVWVDSWHQQPQWTTLAGSVSAQRLSVATTYGEGDQQGGWHIHIHLDQPEMLVMTMDNEMGHSGQYEVVRSVWRRT